MAALRFVAAAGRVLVLGFGDPTAAQIQSRQFGQPLLDVFPGRAFVGEAKAFHPQGGITNRCRVLETMHSCQSS